MPEPVTTRPEAPPPWPVSVWLAIAASGALGFVPVRDTDLYWHVAAGRAILAQGLFQARDTLSYTRPAADWVDLSWWSNLVLAVLWPLGGVTGMQLGMVGLFGLGAVLTVALGRRLAPAPVAPGLAIAAAWLMVGGAVLRAIPRPDLLQIALVPGLALALHAAVRGSRRATAVAAALAAIWVESHGSFPLGIGMAGLFLLAGPQRRGALIPLGAALLALLLHPEGAGPVVRTVAAQLHRAPYPIEIQEWTALPLTELGTPGPLAALIVLYGLAALSLRRRSGVVGLLALLLALGSFQTNRLLIAAAPLAGAVLVAGLHPLRVRRAGLVAAGTALLVGSLALINPNHRLRTGTTDRAWPAAILRTLSALPPGHAFTDFTVGAAVGFETGWTVGMDARAEVFYPPALAAAYTAATDGGAGFDAFQQDYPSDAAVVSRGGSLCRDLAGRADWRPVLAGATYALYLRADRVARDGVATLSALPLCGSPLAAAGACEIGDRARLWAEAAALAARDPDPFLAAQAGLVGLYCGAPEAPVRALLDRAVAAAPADALVRLARGAALRRLGDSAWEQDYLRLLWLDRRAAEAL